MEGTVRALTVLLDTLTGTVLVEEPGLLPDTLRSLLVDGLGRGREMGCARPLEVLRPPATPELDPAPTPRVRVSGYYHNSLVEGPGRRSSVLLSGCTLNCPGCWSADLHPAESGVLVPADRLADALLDPAYERDGVSFLGGEPVQQPDGLLALVQALRARGCRHLVCYTGYTYEALVRRARRAPAIGQILDALDILIDGRYVAALAGSAGPWTGSGNQRVIDLVATRRTGRMVLYRHRGSAVS